MSRPPLRVAVLGAGTVGRHVAAAFQAMPERLAPADGAGLVLAGVAVRDVERARERGIAADLLTDAPAHLVASPEIDVVVELLGGDEPARTLIAAALGAGKPVVTANKHVLAHHGPTLEAIARRAGVALRFEAAVGAGIPVLGPLAAELAANRIESIRGIVNGTTNVILSAMAEHGRTYAEALAAAQRAGYAEADPSGDVDGDDAVNKLVILVRLAFGVWLEPASIERCPPTVAGRGQPGISGVRADEVAAATAHGLALRLIASARRGLDGAIIASVLPTAVLVASSFGQTSGVLNRIEISGSPLGQIALVGPGAGGLSTSSAVLGDLIAVARSDASTWAGLAPAIGPAIPAAADERPRRRFFASTLPDQLVRDQVEIEVARAGGFITTAQPLGELRAALAAAGVDATLYPIDG